MNHGILDVLSVWWIVVAIDLLVVYTFVKIANRSKI